MLDVSWYVNTRELMQLPITYSKASPVLPTLVEEDVEQVVANVHNFQGNSPSIKWMVRVLLLFRCTGYQC